MSEPMVDLLLVRLGGDEEKKKVIRLLMMELDMTVGEAEKAVEESPVVLRESVPIGEARIIQKSLYPYLDLLPRLEGEQTESLREKARSISTPSDTDRFDDGETPGMDDDTEVPVSSSNEEEEDFLLTTASEEMIQIERCHICGKTPIGGERLAPCRTCGDLTCRECFDRTAHVCHKCAADGHSVDRPVAARSAAAAVEHHTPNRAEAPVSGDKRPTDLIRKIIIAVVVLGVLALFYFADPLSLFHGPTDRGTVSATPDSAALAGQQDTVPVYVPPADTIPPGNTANDPLGILPLVDPDLVLPGVPPERIEAYSRLPQGLPYSSAHEELELLMPRIRLIAHQAGIRVDRASLLIHGDREKADHLLILILAVNHPENSEVRLALLSGLAEWLTPGGVDQLVLFYRETRFHTPQPFSYTSHVFSQLAQARSPMEFQDLAGTHEAVWPSLSGPVMEWICEM